jgi:hypothetical protein
MSKFLTNELNSALLDLDTRQSTAAEAPTTKEQEAQMALYRMLMIDLAPNDSNAPR